MVDPVFGMPPCGVMMRRLLPLMFVLQMFALQGCVFLLPPPQPVADFDPHRLVGGWLGTADFTGSDEGVVDASFEPAGAGLTGVLLLDGWEYDVDETTADADKVTLTFTDPLGAHDLVMDLWLEQGSLIGTFEEDSCAGREATCAVTGLLEADRVSTEE